MRTTQGVNGNHLYFSLSHIPSGYDIQTEVIYEIISWILICAYELGSILGELLAHQVPREKRGEMCKMYHILYIYIKIYEAGQTICDKPKYIKTRGPQIARFF